MSALKCYWEAAAGKSNTEAQSFATDIIGSQVDWDWDHALFFAHLFYLTSNVGNAVLWTHKGYYCTIGGIDVAVSRAYAILPPPCDAIERNCSKK